MISVLIAEKIFRQLTLESQERVSSVYVLAACGPQYEKWIKIEDRLKMKLRWWAESEIFIAENMRRAAERVFQVSEKYRSNDLHDSFERDIFSTRIRWNLWSHEIIAAFMADFAEKTFYCSSFHIVDISCAWRSCKIRYRTKKTLISHSSGITKFLCAPLC